MRTDKRNPAISVEAPDSLTLHVYYGLELMEVIKRDQPSGGYQLLAGRLYNAGVNSRADGTPLLMEWSDNFHDLRPSRTAGRGIQRGLLGAKLLV